VLALLAAYDAVTAERDRLLVTVERQGNANEGLGARIRELRAALAQAERDLSWTEPQRPRVKKARADMKAALWRDDHPGHTHPRPCSICRREDCTVLHACE
jgi:type II secretory pathway component PulJ